MPEQPGEVVVAIDAYCDAAPRVSARAEEHGGLVLFVNERGWSYYARPRRDGVAPSPADVEAVRERQRELGVPEAFEWVEHVVPAMAEIADAAGLAVWRHQLMALPDGARARAPVPEGVELRLVTAGDDLAGVVGVAAVAFGAPGPVQSLSLVEFVRGRIESGATVTVAAFDGGEPVAVGSHQPVGGVTEIAGVGTLPAWRRRGLGAAVTALLVEDARRRRGIGTIFLSAGDERVARLYARLGFVPVGIACASGPVP